MRAWGAHDTHALSSTPKVCSTPRCAHALPPPLPLPQASTTEGPPTTIPLGQAATAHGTSELQRAATARRPLATGNSGDGTRNGQGLPGMGAVALVLQGRCPLGSMCTSGLLHTPLCCCPPPPSRCCWHQTRCTQPRVVPPSHFRSMRCGSVCCSRGSAGEDSQRQPAHPSPSPLLEGRPGTSLEFLHSPGAFVHPFSFHTAPYPTHGLRSVLFTARTLSVEGDGNLLSEAAVFGGVASQLMLYAPPSA